MSLSKDTFVRLCQARDMLRAVPDEPISIQHVARQVGMSPYHFIRRFESLFGQTPHQFRIATRIDRARVLLAGGQHSVTEVCMEVGMSSLGSFTDLFVRRVGTTPSAFQRCARVVVPVPRALPASLFPGCLSLMSLLPPSAFRNFREAAPAGAPVESGKTHNGGRNANQTYGAHGQRSG